MWAVELGILKGREVCVYGRKLGVWGWFLGSGSTRGEVEMLSVWVWFGEELGWIFGGGDGLVCREKETGICRRKEEGDSDSSHALSLASLNWQKVVNEWGETGFNKKELELLVDSNSTERGKTSAEGYDRRGDA